MDTAKDFYTRVIAPLRERMMRVVWRITRNADDAEDALQTTMERILRQRAIVERHPNPPALVLRICANAALDCLRRRVRHSGLPLIEDCHRDPTQPLAERLDQRDAVQAVLRALTALPEQQATALALRTLEDQSYEQIAQVLGCRESTARKHVQRAREALARQFPDLAPRHPCD